MAACTSLLLKCPVNLVFLRSLKNVKHSLRICQYSTSKVLNNEEKPVKFTTSSAGKMSIAETTGLYGDSPENKIKKFVIVSSVGVFLLYFCLLREENDVDAMLDGNQAFKPDQAELVDLRLKLAYCEKANLPTAKLKARLEELEDKLRKPVFPK